MSRILAESETAVGALPRVLEVLCQYLGWDLGNVWWVDAEVQLLRFKETWHRDGLSFQAFDQATATRDFAIGVGLPGRVWATAEPYWLNNVVDDESFPRASAASRDGLHLASAFPIILSQDVIGVLEFFSREVRDVDEDLVETMAAIGRQVGQFVERSSAEERLRESEARNAAILATALDCIVTIDHEDRIVEFNPAAEKTFGYSHDDVIGKRMAELLVPPKHRDAHYRGMRHYLETGEGPVLGKRIELEAMRADGALFPVELAITPIRIGDKPIFTAYLRDITERKRSEEELGQARQELESRVTERTQELAREKAFLQAVLENIEDGIVACDENGVLTLFNRATKELHGLPQEPIPAEKWAERYNLFAADGETPLAVDQVPLFRALGGEHVKAVEMVIAPMNGERRALVSSGQPIYDDNGQKLGAVVSMHDITDRKAAEDARAEVVRQQELRRTEERLTEILERINDGFVILDADWRIVYVNAAAERINGQRREDLVNRNHWEVYPAAVGTTVHKEFLRVAAERAAS
ncbi:MAG: PAS domain S-box protein, partial [Pirellulales bacterium]|nr:PAS domain S-box protein [Pirellulales bacterium]